jgi:acyl-coenzyme A thioesterase PaaI-like protein
VIPSAARRLPIEGDGRPAFTAPIVEQLGCVERAPGVLVAELTPYVANSAGLLQGGAVALLAEAAAQSAASAVDDVDAVGGTVFDLDVRYLDALRTGPVETSVTRLGERANGERWWRVELRDVGREHRLGTVALARTAAARSTTTS